MDESENILPLIGYRPAMESDVELLYALHVATMKEYVTQTWGWDDTFQASTFRKNYVPASTQIIMYGGKDIGMISVEERHQDIFLRVIEIHPDHQRKGIGATVIKNIITRADLKQKPVRLRVLKVNPAKVLYDRLGFSTVEETATHYIMQRPLTK